MSTAKILFVCSGNSDRSLTAEQLYANRPGLEVRTANTSFVSHNRLTDEKLQWADAILCMEEDRHKRFIENTYPHITREKMIASLNIPDSYMFMETALQKIIRQKVDKLLRAIRKYARRKNRAGKGLFAIQSDRNRQRLFLFFYGLKKQFSLNFGSFSPYL